MDKLTTLKLKYPNGTYSDPILLTVLAENVKVTETQNIIDIINALNNRLDNFSPSGGTATVQFSVVNKNLILS